jgi:glutamine cyclotransferase
MRPATCLFFLAFVIACLDSSGSPIRTESEVTAASGKIPVYTYKIVNVYSHDRSAFTQGLVYENGYMYEGTGMFGRSTLRKVDLKTGSVLQTHKLPDHYFGEGVTIHGNRIIQLTWASNIGFVYDRSSFDLLQVFDYPTEGWGITHDGEHLIMSDGSSTLYFLDPENFEEDHRIDVRANGRSVSRLNELEYIKGEIYANIWLTDRIARIDPLSGRVVGWIELKGILDRKGMPGMDGVLNGIAYDVKNDRLFVTGKWWPKIFEIEVVPYE